jgi:hypothetical protein
LARCTRRWVFFPEHLARSLSLRERVRVREGNSDSLNQASPHPGPLPKGEGVDLEPLPKGEGEEGLTIDMVFDACFDCRRHKRNSINQLRFEADLETNLGYVSSILNYACPKVRKACIFEKGIIKYTGYIT